MDGTPGARVYSSLIFQIDQNQWSLLTALKNCSCIAAGYLIMGVLSQSPVFLQKNQVQVIYYIMYLFIG